jgi:hypothetical protein
MPRKNAMPRKGNEVGQVGFEPTTCRIMRRAAATGAQGSSEGVEGTETDGEGRPSTARISRAVSRDLSRIADVLTECVALPTHGVAEAADLTVPRAMKLLARLESDGAVRRAEIGGVSMWTVAA